MTTPHRREQLLAAAATGTLDAVEHAELDALLRDDPRAREELEALRDDARRLDAWHAPAGEGWLVAEPSAALDARVVSVAGPGSSGSDHDGRRTTGGGRRGRLVLAAALLVLAGSGGTLAVQSLASERPVQGPPGTLGAVETLAPVRGESREPADVQAAFVAHTWGTEAVLDVRRTRPGAAYEVYVVDESGREVEAGGFLGSRVEVHCRVNAAVARQDVSGLRIVDARGATVALARAPRV
jgi:hypothetical protein